MNAQIMKPIIGGLLIGAALFFFPFFLVKVLVFFLIVGLLFRLFGWKRYRGPGGWAYADKIRNMSDEDYHQFKANWSGRCYGNPTKDVQTKTQ
jgi:hypothetical protein